MSVRGRLLRLLALHALGGLLVSAQVVAAPPATAHGSALRADIVFTCMWWSEAQMDGLNPNMPPPKNTEVRLKKWEYTDPVGVPHPDVIDVVVTLANTGAAAVSPLVVEVTGQWKSGPMRNPGQSKWGDRVMLKVFDGLAASPSAPLTLRVPVDVKAMMDSLGKQRMWPYALRATVVVRAPGQAQALVQSSAELPIRPGD